MHFQPLTSPRGPEGSDRSPPPAPQLPREKIYLRAGRWESRPGSAHSATQLRADRQALTDPVLLPLGRDPAGHGGDLARGGRSSSYHSRDASRRASALLRSAGPSAMFRDSACPAATHGAACATRTRSARAGRGHLLGPAAAPPRAPSRRRPRPSRRPAPPPRSPSAGRCDSGRARRPSLSRAQADGGPVFPCWWFAFPRLLHPDSPHEAGLVGGFSGVGVRRAELGAPGAGRGEQGLRGPLPARAGARRPWEALVRAASPPDPHPPGASSPPRSTNRCE